ncbi:DUF2304 domain-containing protein [Patescibacteria group bacterium]|jgi:hypothetical protein|nr:DUF2304 domain-containing protein [Patescibacteria group bacterium]
MLIQFVLIIVLLAALVITWRRATQQVISRREALAWSVLWIGASVVILLPQTTTIVANLFGVGRGADFILYASVVLIFILIFRIFIMLEQMERKLTDLVRREALRDLPKE